MITVGFCRRCGLTGATVDRLARTGRWLVVQRGVHSTSRRCPACAGRGAARGPV